LTGTLKIDENKPTHGLRSAIQLKKIKIKKLVPILFLLFAGAFTGAAVFAEEPAIVWGQIRVEGGSPLSSIRVTAVEEKLGLSQSSVTDPSGTFILMGLPAGSYKMGFEAESFRGHLQDRVVVEPGRVLRLQILIYGIGGQRSFVARVFAVDDTTTISQTIQDESQIGLLPSGNSVWSLVENQDFSATTHRIDVGGVWAGIPALFSARGSSSWTQTSYLLNGLDVTDPYQTGLPLFYPDIFSLSWTQLQNAGLPAQTLTPGGSLDLVPKRGGSKFRGEFTGFYSDGALASSNITPALIKEGIRDADFLNAFREGNFQLSGPLIPEKLYFYSSWTGFNLSRHIAGYPQEDKASLLSGLVQAEYRFGQNSLRFLWTGQAVNSPSLGADKNTPPETTLDQTNRYHVVQAIGDFRLGRNHELRAAIGYTRGNLRSQFQESARDPHRAEIFQGISAGAAPLAGFDDRSSLTLLVNGISFFGNPLHSRHKLEYGFEVTRRSASSHEEIRDNLHLRFFSGNPLEVVKYNTPLDERERGFSASVFVQDAVTLGDFLTVYGGLNLSYCQGRGAPDASIRKENEIRWLNLSPRLGLVLPLSKAGKTAVKFSVARYFFTLPLSWLSYGNPDALGGLVYSWDDKNHDGFYQEGEAQQLIRREGPLFARIDPNILRPYTDELSLGFVQSVGPNWFFSLTGYLRKTAKLVAALNVGVPFSTYQPFRIFDAGDDQLGGTPDDLAFTVFNQSRETLGHDFFLLTNPDAAQRTSRYKGLDLVFYRKYDGRFSFFLSLTATQAEGTANPGNTELENDDGVVGNLYANPNTLINARGRLRFDRAYTGRIGFTLAAPFGIRIGYLIKYYDGQPFARKIIVQGLNQGPFYIMAHPRGVSRYEFNMTHDLRLEKTFEFGGSRLRLMLDGFNIFNQSLATVENEWTGPQYPLRFATEIQSPRVFRLGIAYEF